MHAVLVVDNGKLVAVVQRPDVAGGPPDHVPARQIGRSQERVTSAHADLGSVWRAMRGLR
ncbi:hypothetical protein [Kibdelosporangium phytohabitans]|uniref:Uncharacterized protein n=1 Tax=Kibdelosporangium phytohabitans TaxID=860235 RepID=A0A0N9IEG8_9PSEU|nr:hypothetical protein [Kibdelosporangium phytohabitans]ALG13140.1 hypothetical protein AOZ06_45395 [Kibdelosporangium phytohabitans]MBE1464890.1 hypothetical protein [Kibdelosporangium phytohabitans]